MSLGTLFGVGGTSVISRALGEDKTERAKKACSFCMWACVAVGTFFMALLWIFLDDVTVMLGASENSIGLTKDYMRIGIMLYAIINRKNALKMKNILSFIVLVIFGSIAFEMLWRFS